MYDGDGKRVKSAINMSNGSTTTYFVGGHYEVANGVVTKYYYAGSQRIALRTNGTLNYLLGDHLGSTSLTTDANGIVISEMRYKAWGETRYASGTTPTKYTYTGQYSYAADFGLHFYNARWYDSLLSRFAQADTIIPRGVQGYDRYAYVNNTPTRYTDPSGHDPWWCKNSATPLGCYHNATRGDAYKRDELFSRTFKGSGQNGQWTEEDWGAYFEPKDRTFYWANPDQWINPDPSGIEGWAARVERLASHYSSNQTEAFVRDFAYLYATFPTDKPYLQAAWGDLRNGYYIQESNTGLASAYIDTHIQQQSQAHHYAAVFYIAYFTNEESAGVINCFRDCDNLNWGDIYLGNTAARDGEDFKNMTPSDLAALILDLSKFAPRQYPLYQTP